MITIYHEKTKDFSHNGYGAIDTDIITPSVHWRLNSFFNLEFDYKSEGRNYEHLKNKNILKVPVPFMNPQLFRIYRTADILGGVRVFARHIFYDLLDNLVEDTFIVEKNGQGALVQMFGATQYSHDFKGFSDVTVRNNARIVRRNPVEALLDDGLSNSIISRWGGEVLLDNFNIHLRKRLGANRGVKIEHKKDLLGYESTIDESTVATRIYPRGFDGLELPERYVDSPKLDPDNPKIKIIRYEDVKAAIGEYADDEDAVPLEEAIEELRRLAKEEFEIHHIDEPETSISIDFVSLHNTKEYKHFSHLQAIHPGDTVSVSVPDQKFEVTSRMVEFKSDPRYEDEYLSVTLGNHVSEFTSSSVSPSRMRENISQATDIALRAYQSANTKNTTYWGEANPNDIGGLKPNVDDRYIQENGDVKRFWIFVERNGQKYWHEALSNVENSETKKAIEDTLDKFEELRGNVDTLEGLITIIDGLPYIAGENIYLDGDTNVDGTFTITKEMIAPEVITDHLSATGVNANDIDVFNLTADNFLANRLDIAGGFRIMNGHEEVLTVDSTTGKTIFNAPGVATKEELEKIELTPGPPGPKGEPGKDGRDSYTHIAYATGDQGQTFSHYTFEQATHIGMYVSNNQASSTNWRDYEWTLIKGKDGSQGLRGPEGLGGITPFFHTAYANSADGTVDFSVDDSSDKEYIGQYTSYARTGRGRNYWENSDFELGNHSWLRVPDAKVEGGVKFLSQNYGWNTNYQQFIDSGTYTFSALVRKGTDYQSGRFRISMVFYTSAHVQVGSPQNYYMPIEDTDEWHRVSTTITIPEGTEYIQGFLLNSDPDSGDIDMARFKLEKGSEATEYSIAPEDAMQDSTNPEDYNWTKIKGEQGPQGVKGEDGEDGKPTYTWIRYADTVTGSGISNSPSDKEYIGLTHNKDTPIESNDPNDYTWSLIRGPKGEDGNRGVEGPKGKDGQTTYTWIKYSANANGSGLTDTPQANTAYIGIATNKTTPDESNTPSDYTWSLFKGPKGEDGEPGPKGEDGKDGSDGVSVSSTRMQFYQSTSSTELKGGVWSDTPPNWKDGQYIWTRIATNYSNGQTSVSEPVNATGQTGSTGQSGRSVVNVSGQYYLSSSKEQLTGGAWVNSPPIWQQGFYVWTRLKIDYSNPSDTEYTEPTVDSSWEAIDGLVYENRNLLKNSNDFSMFKPYLGSSIEHQENQPIEEAGISEGTRLVISGGTHAIKTTPTISVNSDYKGDLTYSFWAKNNGNEPIAIRFNGLVQDDGTAFTPMETLEPNEARRITAHGRMRDDYDWFQHQIYQLQDGQTIDVTLAQMKLEKGTKATPYNIAPEDIQEQIDSKASQDSLDEVSTKLSDFQTVVASREELGEVTSALYDYIDDLYRNERNLESAREDIDRLLTRLPIIENNLGAWVERWSFLDTYVTLGDEGLMISEMNGSTGIRISKDRIDFLDGSGEPVAYITNQVMRINRGIFVDSMQVGEHKIETVAGGHTIWQWMGG